MTRSFADKDTERLWRRERVKGIDPRVLQAALRKLRMLSSATKLSELRIPPGNRLEALKGNRKGQHSIRVNDQWRICFTWRDGGTEDVEFVNCH